MENEPQITQDQTIKVKLIPPEETAIINFDKIIDLNSAPVNSVLIIKLNTADQLYANNLQMGIIERILNPRAAILKEKHLTVLFMASTDDISLLTEEDMLSAGWIKKEKSRIITP